MTISHLNPVGNLARASFDKKLKIFSLLGGGVGAHLINRHVI